MVSDRSVHCWTFFYLNLTVPTEAVTVPQGIIRTAFMTQGMSTLRHFPLDNNIRFYIE